ncbi:hypothetical protein D3C81_938890 [compost metagenome]
MVGLDVAGRAGQLATQFAERSRQQVERASGDIACGFGIDRITLIQQRVELCRQQAADALPTRYPQRRAFVRVLQPAAKQVARQADDQLLQMAAECPLEGAAAIVEHAITGPERHAALTLGQQAFALQLEAVEEGVVRTLHDVLAVVLAAAFHRSHPAEMEHAELLLDQSCTERAAGFQADAQWCAATLDRCFPGIDVVEEGFIERPFGHLCGTCREQLGRVHLCTPGWTSALDYPHICPRPGFVLLARSLAMSAILALAARSSCVDQSSGCTSSMLRARATGRFPGRLRTPQTVRTCPARSAKTSANSSEALSITCGWLVKDSSQAT